VYRHTFVPYADVSTCTTAQNTQQLNQAMAAGRRRVITGHHHQHFAKHEVRYLLSVPSGGRAIWGFSFHKETRYTYGVKSGVDESTDVVQERRCVAKKVKILPNFYQIWEYKRIASAYPWYDFNEIFGDCAELQLGSCPKIWKN